jgi:glyoxylase-like metal-dependent hydrolase (beta-lactamase superfamily II)
MSQFNLKFDLEFDPNYGKITQISPLIRRIVAENPSMFTFKGTGTYIVGKKGGPTAIIDPGPDLDSHIKDLKFHLRGEKISHILITHNHIDHSPAARAIKEHFGADIYGFDPASVFKNAKDDDYGIDRRFKADHYLKDGDFIRTEDWTLEIIHTAGHISNHICFALAQEKALFCGDHVMGWSSSVVIPPDGDMEDYMQSLEKLLTRDEVIYYPTHGAPIEQPKEFTHQLLMHRKDRENEIIDILQENPLCLMQIVRCIYKDIPEHLHPVAAKSILAHLILLERQGRTNSSHSSKKEDVRIFSLAF